MSDKYSRAIDNVVSLDETRCRRAIHTGMGKFGTAWVLEEIARVYDYIGEQSASDPLQQQNANMSALVLRSLKMMFLMQIEQPSDDPLVTA